MTKQQQEQYTELEKEAQSWLDETDTMQFSQVELLTMFTAKKVKDYDLLHNVSNQRELLIAYTLWLDKDYKQGGTDARLVNSFIKESNL